MLPYQLRTLPPDAATALARHYDELAAELRAHAAARRYELERRAREEAALDASAADQDKRIGRAAAIIDQQIAAGISPAAAVDRACRAAGIAPATFRIAARLRRIEARQVMQLGREIDVMGLAARGWSNRQIAAELGYKCPGSVTRIIRRRLEAARRHVGVEVVAVINRPAIGDAIGQRLKPVSDIGKRGRLRTDGRGAEGGFAFHQHVDHAAGERQGQQVHA